MTNAENTRTVDPAMNLSMIVKLLSGGRIFDIAKWAGGEKRDESAWTLPFPEYRVEVEGFFTALGEFLLLWTPTSSDYLETSRELRDDHDAIGSAGPDEVKALLTFVWRGEKFCDGFWEAQLQSGLVTVLLDRLHELHRMRKVKRVEQRS